MRKLKVCIIQPVMKQYRSPFFIQLEGILSKNNIELQVVYGTPWPEEALRGDNIDLSEPLGIKVPTYRLFKKLFFQSSFKAWFRADLIILEPANKHLLNYLMLLLYAFKIKKIAYWGHGYDRQSNAKTLGNRFKKKVLHWASWWFAYTQGAADYLAHQNFDAKKITVVENAVDTRMLRELIADVTVGEVDKVKLSIGWKGEAKIGVFCGSLYKNKCLDLLFESADLIHKKNPDFRLLILGGGTLIGAVRDYAVTRKWVNFAGPVFGREKAIYLRMSDIWLNPGLVGLGILDGFSAGLPIITTDVPFHSPEIEYLQNGVNGLMTAPDAGSYATAIEGLLDNKKQLLSLKNGALTSSRYFSIETMVSNFSEGIIRCLKK